MESGREETADGGQNQGRINSTADQQNDARMWQYVAMAMSIQQTEWDMLPIVPFFDIIIIAMVVALGFHWTWKLCCAKT